jgi:hypothetical protein
VAFVDLVGSTELKHQVSVPRWLGYVVRFLELVTAAARAHDGTLVKRIGDELMLTFKVPNSADAFLADLSSAQLANFPCKAAADYGTAYSLTFTEDRELDPYGSVVDRAARIAKLATKDVVLASDDFVQGLTNANSYASLGRFTLKGIPEPQELYLRKSSAVDRAQYLQRLLNVLNSDDAIEPRFRYASRKFSLSDFELKQHQRAHPFLARELLALPKLPYSFLEFERLRVKDASATSAYTGHLVEWEGSVHSITYDKHGGDYYTLALAPVSRVFEGGMAIIYFPREMSECLRRFTKGDHVEVRAIFMETQLSLLVLDYADIRALP